MRRLWHAILRAPMVAVAYVFSGSASHPIADLAGEIAAAGFQIVKEVVMKGDGLALIVGRQIEAKKAG